mgnify:FL=1
MMSLFDDDEVVFRRRPAVTAPLQARHHLTYTIGSTLTYRTSPRSKRRRTVGEALQRIYDASPPDFEAAGLYALARPTRKPFMIYNAARVGAAALVMIDPLNRLEGGIID